VAALCVAVLSVAVPAAAQAPAAQQTQANSAPMVTLWYAGIITGVAAVEQAGGAIGGEAGMRVWRNFDVSLEGGWFQDTNTKHRSDLAAQLATFIQQREGQTATSSVDAPTTYFAANGRWVFENTGRFRPYAMAGIGAARVEINSTFTLAGQDITGSLPSYGVTLGSDLSGHSSHFLVSAGVGVLVPIGKFYGDIGYRITSIQTPDQTSNVNRLVVAFGVRF
jgi:opacity protein-like surface antigen